MKGVGELVGREAAGGEGAESEVKFAGEGGGHEGAGEALDGGGRGAWAAEVGRERGRQDRNVGGVVELDQEGVGVGGRGADDERGVGGVGGIGGDGISGEVKAVGGAEDEGDDAAAGGDAYVEFAVFEEEAAQVLELAFGDKERRVGVVEDDGG